MSQPDSTIEDKLKEKLAAIEHERWSDWQKWCHKILWENIPTDVMQDYVYPILKRWEIQADTPYDNLSDKEKASDMEQVDRYWPLLQDYVNDLVSKSLEASLDLSNPQIKAIITTETTKAYNKGFTDAITKRKKLFKNGKALQKERHD